MIINNVTPEQENELIKVIPKRTLSINVTKTIKEYSNLVWSVLLLNDQRIAFSSDDLAIKIFNLKTFHCYIYLLGHKKIITSIIQIKNGKLISSAEDNSIKIWILFKFSFICEYTFENAHNHWVTKVIELSDNRIASCSLDLTIKIWNHSSPYNLIKVLEGHTRWVSSIVGLKNQLFLISISYYDKTLRVWDLKSYQCQTVITNVMSYWNNGVLELDNQKLLIGGPSKLYILNTVTFIVEKEIKNANLKGDISAFLQINDHYILCSYGKGNMCIYNSNTNSLAFVLDKIHSGELTQIAKIAKNKFVSSSCDCTVKVWKFVLNESYKY